jgi:hypothetical protein
MGKIHDVTGISGPKGDSGASYSQTSSQPQGVRLGVDSRYLLQTCCNAARKAPCTRKNCTISSFSHCRRLALAYVAANYHYFLV